MTTTVSKADGSISYLTIPPLEDLDILEAAEIIYNFFRRVGMASESHSSMLLLRVYHSHFSHV